MWDKVKNNTFVNMFYPFQDLSEGNTEALLAGTVPGVSAARTTARLAIPEVSRAEMVLKYGPEKYTKRMAQINKQRSILEKTRPQNWYEVNASGHGIHYTPEYQAWLQTKNGQLYTKLNKEENALMESGRWEGSTYIGPDKTGYISGDYMWNGQSWIPITK